MDALAQRTAELAHLQQEFDDFMDSSKELEAELHAALQEAENKANDAVRKKAALEDRVAQLQKQLGDASKGSNSITSELERLKSRCADLESSKRSLELQTDSLEEKLRIAESSQADLANKLERREEDYVFLQNDLEDLAQEKTASEQRLKAELTELMSELAAKDNAAAGAADGANSQEEIESLNQRLAESDQMCADLNEELERAGEEVIRLTGESAALKQTVAGLQKELADTKALYEAAEAKARELQENNAGSAANAAVLAEREGVINDLTAMLQENEDRVNEMSTDLENANDELMRLATDNKSIQKSLEDSKSEFQRTEENLRNQVASLEAELQKSAQLTIELESLRKELSDAVEGRKRLENEISSLTEASASAKMESSTLQSRLDSSEAELHEVNEKLTAASQRASSLDQDVQRLTRESNQKLEDLEKLREELQLKLSSVAAELTDSNSRAAEAENQVVSLQSLLAAEKESLEETRCQLSDAEERASLAHAEFESLKAESAASLEGFAHQAAALTSELQSAKEERDDLKTRTTRAEQEVADLQATFQNTKVEFEATLSSKEQAKSDVEKELASAHQDAEEARRRASDAEGRISTLEMELTAMKSLSTGNNEQYLQQCADLDVRLKAAVKEHEAATTRASSAEQRALHLDAELADVHETNSQRTAASESERMELQTQLAAAQSNLTAVSERSATLEDRVLALEKELAGVQSEADERSIDMEALHSQVESRLTDALRDVEAAESKLATSEEKYEKLQVELRDTHEALAKNKAEFAEILAARDERIEILMGEIETLRRKVVDLESARTLESNAETQSLLSRISELESQLISMSSDHQTYGGQNEEEILQLKQQRDELKDRVTRLEDALQVSSSELASVKASLDAEESTHSSTISDLESKLVESNRTVDELKQRVNVLSSAMESHPSVPDAVAVAVVTTSEDTDTEPYRFRLEQELQKAFEELNLRNEEIRVLKAEISSAVSVKHHSPTHVLDYSPHREASSHGAHHPVVSVAALPSDKYEASDNVEKSLEAFQKQQQTHDKYMLDPIGSVDEKVNRVMESDDPALIKAELKAMLERYDVLRASNAATLQKMHNLKGNIQVCCRPRPPLPQEIRDGARVCVDTSENELAFYDKRGEAWRSFAFDKVWPMDSLQADVFADVEPLALSVVDGFNTCILAFGQTGSGKTFTMNGYGGEYGVSYRTMHKVFEVLHLRKAMAIKRAEKERLLHKKTPPADVNCGASVSEESVSGTRSSKHAGENTEDVAAEKTEEVESDDDESVNESPAFEFSISVSMMEIYNESVRDLLSAESSEGLEIRQSPEGGVHVPGLVQESVNTLSDAMRVFARGSANRATMTTNLNEYSSRSHSILMVDVVSTEKGASPVAGKLFLVDLAGSERVEKSGVTGAALKEAQYINKSLSALGDVMEALDQKSKHIPYRNSKLTYLLQDSLGGNSRTMMIVTICPTDLSSDESLFALQFATRVRRINLGPARKNINSKNLEENIRQLKNELKDSKKKRMQLEESLNEMKREIKRTTEKMSSQTDTKARVLDDAKRSFESQLKAMEKTNKDLAVKVQEEKAEKTQLSHELENANKSIKKMQDQIKTLSRDKEVVEETLRVKERDLSLMLMSEALNEKPAAVLKKKKSTENVFAALSSSMSSKDDGPKSPTRKEESLTLVNHSDDNAGGFDSVSDPVSPPKQTESLPAAIAGSRILRSGRVVRPGSAPTALAIPAPRPLKKTSVTSLKTEKIEAVATTTSDSPPPKKSAVVLTSQSSSSGNLHQALTKAAVAASTGSVSGIPAVPKYSSSAKTWVDPAHDSMTGDAIEIASVASSVDETVESENAGVAKAHPRSRIPALRTRASAPATSAKPAVISPTDLPGYVPPTQRSQEALLKHQERMKRKREGIAK